MNITKNNINKVLFGIFTITLLASCNNEGYDDYKPAVTPSVELNGEWYIDIIDADTGDVYAQHVTTRTYDTNGGDGKMVINDFKGAPAPLTGYWIKAPVDTNPSNLTFSAKNAPNTNVPGATTVTVTDGKIIKNAGHSRTGHATDSIYFKVQYSFDTTTTLIYAGHKRDRKSVV